MLQRCTCERERYLSPSLPRRPTVARAPLLSPSLHSSAYTHTTDMLANKTALNIRTVKATTVRRNVQARAELYPEYGTYPGGGESPIVPFSDEKNAEREIIHGRWAMLGVTGAWAAENGTGVPWFKAGELCGPDECTNFVFPGAIAPLAPEGSGFPNFVRFFFSFFFW